MWDTHCDLKDTTELHKNGAVLIQPSFNEADKGGLCSVNLLPWYLRMSGNKRLSTSEPLPKHTHTHTHNSHFLTTSLFLSGIFLWAPGFMIVPFLQEI